MVVPLREKTLPSVVIGLDRALRCFGGAPTYALTDNEKTVTVDHVCGIAVRNPQIVSVARHYGLTIATCVPADPQSKGGSEATVRVAKADLVPTDHNLRPEYGSFAELETACQELMAEVNTRPHRSTMEPPVIRLAEEHERLHPLPKLPHTVCFGETRKVNWQSLISVGGAQYSVPHELIDERVWARTDGDQLIVVHVDGHQGPREVARHRLTTPGRPSITDEHYPPRPAGALQRTPTARNGEERAFLAIGDGAEQWLIKAGAAGTQRVRRKMAEAVDLAKLHGASEVDHALRTRADAGRFAPKRLLLVIDNFEHVLDAAELVAVLLGTSPGLKVLATSREALDLRGEQCVSVPPLALPALSGAVSVAELESAAASALFLDAARRRDSRFGYSPDTAPVIARICARLDGPPLALELAAARIGVLGIDELGARLASIADLGTGPSRTKGGRMPRRRTGKPGSRTITLFSAARSQDAHSAYPRPR